MSDSVVVVRIDRQVAVVPSAPVGSPGGKGDPGSPGEGYPTRVAMAARLVPALLDDVYLTEAGREGKFVVDLASNWTAQIAADTAQGIFVASTADATKVYRRVFGSVAEPEWFGAKGDTIFNSGSGAFVSGTNDAAALTGAINVLRIVGGELHLKGWYRSDTQQTWDDNCIAIVGRGASIQPNDGSGIYFPNSATQSGCIRIKNGSGGKGSGSSARNFAIKGAGAAAVSAADAKLGLGSGLLVQCSGAFQNITAINCEGNGIYALSAPSSPDISINCNGAVFINCTGYSCGNNGRATYGVDSNSLTFLGGGALQNTQFGDYINGLEGSTVIGPNYEGNAGGLLRLGDITGHNDVLRITGEGTSYLVQLDSGGSGYNTVEFATVGANVTWTDNSGTGTNDLKWQNVKRTARFGGDGANGTTIISDGLILQRLGAKLQMQDNPLTANWFFYNLGGKPVLEDGGTEYYQFGTTSLALDAGITIKIGANQVIGPRQTGTPSDATDLATALTLINSMKAKLIAHGLIS